MSLNAANKIADQTLLSAIDSTYNYQDEVVKMDKELSDKMNYSKKQNMMTTEIQGQCQITAAGYQAEAQQKGQQASMGFQYEMISKLQQQAAKGDQAAQFQLDQLMGPQNPNGDQGGAEGEAGQDPNAQGQPGQPGQTDPNQIIQLALMPPDQLQAAVQQGQVDPQSAQAAQQLQQLAQQPPEQLNQMLQQGQIDQQTLQMVQAVQQQGGQQQGQGGMAPNGSMMADGSQVDENGMAMDAAQQTMPNMQAPEFVKLVAGYAKQLADLPTEARKAVMTRMQESNPALYEQVSSAYTKYRQMIMNGVPQSQMDQEAAAADGAQSQQ
jgi:hypothetical protein